MKSGSGRPWQPVSSSRKRSKKPACATQGLVFEDDNAYVCFPSSGFAMSNVLLNGLL